MPASLPFQLSPTVVGVVQWTLVGVELLVLAFVVAWLVRRSHLRRLLRPFARRAVDPPAAEVSVGAARPARLVSMGGGPPAPLRPDAPRGASRNAPRPLRLTRTPARPTPAVGSAPHAEAPPSMLHCPCCGTLVSRGDTQPRMVTRCPGCERRLAVRTDAGRVIVTVEGD